MIDLFIQIRLLDIIDIILVALFFYWLYYLLKGTVAINIFIGIVSIFLLWQIVNALQMKLLNTILGAFVSVGFIALIIIFQPEIRRFLFTIGTPNFIKKFKQRFKIFGEEKQYSIDTKPITLACANMSKDKVGALIVLTRQNQLTDILESGVAINAEMSSPLIENIFFKNSPLHDGAMIITDDKIVAARCILPVSNNLKLPGQFGLRHRAAIGITEEHDCIAIVVSEETGKISLVKGGKASYYKAEDLDNIIKKEMSNNDTSLKQ